MLIKVKYDQLLCLISHLRFFFIEYGLNKSIKVNMYKYPLL